MSKVKNELLFTFGEGKKAETLNRKDFLTKVLAKFTKENKEPKLEAKHLNALLDLSIGGDEPDDEVPDVVKELFTEIDAAYKAAKEAFDDREAEAKAEKDAEETAKAEKDKETKELVSYVSEAPSGSEALDSFRDKFDLGENLNQCVPKEGADVTLKDWVGVLSFGIGLENASQWIIGDAVVAIENAGHEDVVVQMSAQFKKSYPTISGYARTSRAFPVDARDSSISFTAYREIGNAKFDGDEKKVAKIRETLVKDTKKNQWSALEVRDAVRTKQGKETSTPATGAVFKYLDLNVENFGNSSLVSELPAEIAEGHVIVDMSKKSYLVRSDKDGTVTESWVEFPQHS